MNKSAAATIERIEKAPADEKTKPRRQPPYAVVILDDDLHTFGYVIETLQKVFGYEKQKCQRLTNTIHTEGQAHVWTGTLEVAELKRDQIQSAGPDFYALETVKFPLGVRLEPLPQ